MISGNYQNDCHEIPHGQNHPRIGRRSVGVGSPRALLIVKKSILKHEANGRVF
jgi:hypothetical protein